ncbi:OmpA family protein [Burkholderia sp. JKS000303]|uniref:OmpA family protein n=1 Tax=Burkholderia sp. JKS000303 TaxID=1938747 RepID=UPI000C00A95E|nr:OmpA family protein [Burkholderia sp. JKS000303]PFH20997.1 outer membrane protein OmpA-like peptidoglycan-associated protein [Burkholderia sp. JKS000303]
MAGVAALAMLTALTVSGCHRKQQETGSTQGDNAASAPASAPAAAPASAQQAAPVAATPAEIDVAGLTAGAFAVGAKDTSWFRLLDGVPDSPGIQVNDNPYTLTIALPATATITSFAMTSNALQKITAHHVKVEASTQGANGPWSTAYDAEFANAATVGPGVTQRARLASPVSAKWLRLTLSSPQDAAPYGIGLARFAALGTFDGAPQAVRQIGGLYHFPLQFGSSGYVLLQQSGASVSGCYFEAAHTGGDDVKVGQVLGTIVGGIESGGYLRFTRNDGQSGTGTPGVMVFSPDAHDAFAMLFKGDAHTFGQVDESPGTRIGASTLTCEASGQPDPLAEQLQQTGRVQLYGVNFDLDQATLRADAKPMLDKAAAILKAHPGWKIEVGGHTDSSGAADHNATLSEARAKAVEQYLVAAGVPAGDLGAKGYGATRPLMPNDTEIGRAQNRRVELVKQ